MALPVARRALPVAGRRSESDSELDSESAAESGPVTRPLRPLAVPMATFSSTRW